MLEFHIPDMSCDGCVQAITRALQKLDSKTRLETDLETRTLRVYSAAREQAVRDALEEAGFAAQ